MYEIILFIPIIFILIEYSKDKKIFTFGNYFNILAIMYFGYGLYGIPNTDVNNVISTSALISILGFNIGYRLLKSKKEIIYIKNKFNQNYDLSIFILILLGLLVEFYIIFSVGPSTFFLSDRVTRMFYLKDYGNLLFYDALFNVAALMSLHRYFTSRRKRYLLLTIFAISNNLLFAILTISRSIILFTFLPIVLYLYKKNIVKNKRIIIYGVVIIGLFLFYRGFLYQLILNENIGESLQFGELVVWRRNFTNVLRWNMDYNIGGESFINTIESIINPLSKGAGLSTWYIKNFEYNVYLAGGGRGFSGIAEAYFNFGYIGVFIIFILYGLLVKYLQNNQKNFFSYMISIFFLINMHKIFRAESYSVFKFWIWFNVIPILFIYIFVEKIMVNRVKVIN